LLHVGSFLLTALNASDEKALPAQYGVLMILNLLHRPQYNTVWNSISTNKLTLLSLNISRTIQINRQQQQQHHLRIFSLATMKTTYEQTRKKQSTTKKKNNTDMFASSKSTTTRTTKHSWYKTVAHIPRRGGKTFVRGFISDLVLGDGYIAVNVEFVEKRKRKNKLFSPITIAALQTHWLDRNFVSDDDDEEKAENTGHHHNKIVPSVTYLLPPLMLHCPHEHTLDQQNQLQWCLSQTNSFLVMTL
jgi:hypothetical protein